MKDNLYTKTMENIKAPQKLVDNTIEQMREAGENSKVITFEKPKRRALKFVSAVAAVLALIIGLSVIPFGDGISTSDNEHNFVLKVGAAEITPDVYAEAGVLDNSGGGAEFLAIEEKENNDFGMDGTYNVMSINRIFYPHKLIIEGENIESVTYTANNCYLAYDTLFDGIVDVQTISEEKLEKECRIHYYYSYDWAKYCTLDYQKQQISIESGEWHRVPTIGVEFFFKFEEGEFVMETNGENYIDTEPLFEETFNTHADEFSLDITANFKDGVSVTKTLKFKCENTSDRGLVLYAKEVQ